LWYKIKEIDPIYAQFLTPKQAQELGLTPVVTEFQLAENARNSIAESEGTELMKEMYDEDTVIFMLPPLLDSQSELPGHYHNPHKLP
jgi:hypothetical protein